jgi:O-antigen/teichoic acid export membrane protein
LDSPSLETGGGVAVAVPQPEAAKEHRAFWGVFQGMVGGVITLLLNASTGILTARALLPAGRGDLAAMTLWPLLLAYITGLGMPSSLIYFLRNKQQESSRLIPTGLLASLVFGSIASLAAAFLLPFWLHHYSPTVVRVAQLLLMATPICAMIQSGRAVLEASGSFLTSNIVQVTQPAATLAMLLCLLAVHHLNPVTAACAYIFATVPTLLILLAHVRRLVVDRWRVEIASLRLLLSYGIRSSGIDVLGTLALQVDQLLVISLLTPSAMGIYGVALSLSRMFNLFQAAVVVVLFPRASGREANDVCEMTAFSARVSTMVTGGCALGVALVGPFLLKLLYGRPFSAAASTLQILLVEVTVSGLVYVLAQAYMALGRPGIVTIVQLVGLSLSVPLMLVLIPRWGINGAATALLASTVARFVFVYFGFGWFLHLRRPELAPRVSDAKAIFDRLKKAPVLRRFAH